MPRKSSFTREQIASRALHLIRDKGAEHLSARSLGAALGCSSSPIFTLYSGMDEVLGEVRKMANKVFNDYVNDVMDYQPAFKEFSIRLMRFARKETNLFYFLFMQKHPAAKKDLHPMALACLQDLKEGFGFNDQQVDFVCQQMWAFTCGLTVLSVKQPTQYSEELVSEMLSRQFSATIDIVKSGKKVPVVVPKRH